MSTISYQDQQFLNMVDQLEEFQSTETRILNGHSVWCNPESCDFDGQMCEAVIEEMSRVEREQDDAAEGAVILDAWLGRS